MSSKSDECGCCCSVVSTPVKPDLIVSVASQATQTNSIAGNEPQVITSLLEQNNSVRAEIFALENLLCEKYAELMTLQSVDPQQNSTGCSNQYKLQRAVSVIDDLERFSQEDGLNEDAVDEYIRYLEYMYTQVPIIGPDAVQMICYSPLERTRQYLETRTTPNSQKMLFVLKDNDHYSLILYNAAEAAFYHYDVTKERSDLAQQLMFTLRQCLNATRFIEVDENSFYTDSALFCIDNMIQIILNAEEENATTPEMEVPQLQAQSQSQSHSQSQSSPTTTLPPSTPVQMLQMHSQPDYLKIIIMSRYIVTKLSQIEKLCSGDDEQRWLLSP